MAETVEQIREWHVATSFSGPGKDPAIRAYREVHEHIGTLLAEIDRLEAKDAGNCKMLETYVTTNMRLRALRPLAEAVCDAFDAVRGGLMPSEQSSDYATERYKELWRELLVVFGKYLAGKQETDDGEEEPP
jgi:hypothetical protein